MTNEQVFFDAYLWAAEQLMGLDQERPLRPQPTFAPETLGRMRVDCVKFLHMDPGAPVTAFLDSLTDDELAQAGTDFWLTRNGHGAGFWDGDWDYRDYGEADWGPALTKRIKTFPTCDLYVGDDGLIYC